jgi:hypothetical protein
MPEEDTHHPGPQHDGRESIRLCNPAFFSSVLQLVAQQLGINGGYSALHSHIINNSAKLGSATITFTPPILKPSIGSTTPTTAASTAKREQSLA